MKGKTTGSGKESNRERRTEIPKEAKFVVKRRKRNTESRSPRVSGNGSAKRAGEGSQPGRFSRADEGRGKKKNRERGVQSISRQRKKTRKEIAGTGRTRRCLFPEKNYLKSVKGKSSNQEYETNKKLRTQKNKGPLQKKKFARNQIKRGVEYNRASPVSG